MPSIRPGRRRREPDSPQVDADGLPVIVGYTEFAVIGRGASSTVYRARQEAFGRDVAVKLLHVDVSDRKAQRRFEREREINGRLSHHPNVVTVLDAGFVDGRYPYLTMELFEHGSLAQRLSERGPFTVADTLHIGVRIAGALASAHAAGVLHRDVKPQNILLSRFGEPALADFGIAGLLELEQSMTAALTPVHSAPEILEGGDPSPRSDVYALGSTLYTLLSGVPPFAGPAGEGVLAQLLRITTVELPALGRADVPEALFALLRQATAKRPDERPPDAVTFGRALQAIEADLGLGATALPLDVPTAPEPAPDQPAPDPAAAGIAPEVPGDLTVDYVAPVVDTPTVAARQAAPELAPRPPRRRLAVVAGVLAVGAAAAGGWALWRDDSAGTAAPATTVTVATMPATMPATTPATVTTPVTTPATLPSTAPPVTTAPVDTLPATLTADELALAATDLTPKIRAESVTLEWRDHSDGRRTWLEVLWPGEGIVTPQVLADNEVGFVEVDDVAPTDSVCFVVRTFVRYAPDGAALTADSPTACINAADATPVTAAP